MPPIKLTKLSKDLDGLRQIETRLNERIKSAAFRDELLADPVKVLKREGLEVPLDKQKHLVEFCKNLKIPANAPLRLAANMAAAPDRGVMISIGIRW